MWAGRIFSQTTRRRWNCIDDLIQQELAYYQEIYREEGLSGLLNRF